jgi:hypothetical protein
VSSSAPNVRQGRAFLVAAVALPLLVAAFFLVAVTVPRWTVAAPNHDLLVRVQRYGGPPSATALDLQVENGTVVTTVRPVPKDSYPSRWTLLLVDPLAQSVREIPLDVPTDMAADAPPLRRPVAGLAGVTVSADPVAPDGYRLQPPPTRGPGILGGIFGMGRSEPRMVLVKQGRTVRIDVPQAEMDPYGPVHVVGWVIAPKSR